MQFNTELIKFKEEIKNKRIAVLGIGISNIPAIKYLVSLGAKVEARDKRQALDSECSELYKLNIDFVLGDNYLVGLEGFDYIIRSPGIRPFLPEIQNAAKSGVILSSEIELFVDLCPAKIVGVTGSDGKTTTTTLISKFLEESGYKVWLGGNIGKPLFSKLDEITSEDIVVLELSSFQLMTMKKSPSISIITNISPNHLDYHTSFDEYIDSKANIFKYQKMEDIVVFNNDNSYTKRYVKNITDFKINTNIRYFSVVEDIKQGVFLKNGYIFSNVDNKEEVIAPIGDVKLVGIHNLANICAASSAVIHLTGIEPIKKVITTFKGVEHRMELIREKDGVKWYNDSIGTSPTRTIAGLVSFEKKVILIAGGYDKNIPYDEIGGYIIDKVKILILLGKTAPKIEKATCDEAKKRNIDISDICSIVKVSSLEEAVKYANSVASNGDIVILSPASASFDMYKNFEERGDHFKRIVNTL